MTSKEVSLHLQGSSVSIDAVGKKGGIVCESLRLSVPGSGFILTSDEDVSFAEIDITLEQMERLVKMLTELVDKLKKDKELYEG